ncbi:MAG: phospholipid carrier-dependent glycosyltransferase [Candidatus Xenobium sp.]|jgi:dolichyl-phosphate-mannose-protein mannosyltransferase|nr:phospholipid carrier-dependent glycosyltransferase [Burkholderiales bacterium]
MGRHLPTPKPPPSPGPLEEHPPGSNPPVAWKVPRLDLRDKLLLALVTLFALAVRGWNLGLPAEQYFDEIYYVKAAQDYLSVRPDSNTVHPPMGKIQIAAGMLLADRLDAWLGPTDQIPDSAEWRIASLLSGTLVVPLTFMLGFRMTRGNRSLSLCAAFLVAIDFMSVTLSRISMLDMILAFWMMVGWYCAWRSLEESWNQTPGRWHWATMSALAFGMATACKWNGLFGALGACLAMQFFSGPAGSGPRGRLVRWLAPPLLMALCLPLVYVLSYIPFFQLEGSLGVAAWQKVLGFHRTMIQFRYDASQFQHRYLSHFWEWPLVLRPIWFHYQVENRWVSGIVAFGSIIFWWTSLLYLLEVGLNAFSRRDRAAGFLVLNWLCQWGLWAASTTGGFIYYVLPGVPLLALATGMVLDDWLGSRGSWLAAVYLAVLSVFFVLYYPFLTGLPASEELFTILFPPWAVRWR